MSNQKGVWAVLSFEAFVKRGKRKTFVVDVMSNHRLKRLQIGVHHTAERRPDGDKQPRRKLKVHRLRNFSLRSQKMRKLGIGQTMGPRRTYRGLVFSPLLLSLLVPLWCFGKLHGFSRRNIQELLGR